MTALLLASLLACSGGDADAIPTAEVERGDFEVVLAIPGELKAVNSVTLSAPDLNAQIKVTWVIEEGARVNEGDTLVELDTIELQTDLESAESQLEVARTKIEQKKAQLAVRLADLENTVTSARLSLEKAKLRLTDSETVPRVERESARLDVEEFTLSVERSKASLESARLEGEAELALLRLEADEAESKVDSIRDRLEKCVVKAPSDGLVILPSIWKGGSRGPISTGDNLWAGSTMLELPDLSQMEIEAWVHEVDAGKLAVDQPVSVVIDAYPDPAHAGVVKRVADLAVQRDRESKVKYLKVMIALDETVSVMKPGMTVRGEVLLETVPDVLSVPLEAVFYEEGEPYVYTQGLRGFGRTGVTLGTRNDTHVVITEGLEDDAVVALVDPEAAAAGESPGPSRSGDGGGRSGGDGGGHRGGDGGGRRGR